MPEQGMKFTVPARIHTKVETFLNVIFYSSYYNSDLCTVIVTRLFSFILISRAAAVTVGDIRLNTGVIIVACHSERLLWSVIRNNIYTKGHFCCNNHVPANCSHLRRKPKRNIIWQQVTFHLVKKRNLPHKEKQLTWQICKELSLR